MKRLLPLLLLLAAVGHRPQRVAAGPTANSARIDVLLVRGKDPVPATVELRRLGDVSPAGIDRPWMGARDVDARRLWLEPGAGRGPPLASKATGAGGQTRFDGLPPGRYEVVATDGPTAEARGLVVLEAEGQHAGLTLRLSTGAENLRGELREADGRPFVGLVVVDQPQASRLATPWLDGAWERPTDAEGRFELTGLEPGPVGITALVPGRLRVRLGTVRLPLAERWTGTLPALEGGVKGSVVEFESGRPIGGAEVFASSSDYPASGFTLIRVQSGPDGRFALPSLGGRSELLCVAPGRAASWTELLPRDGELAPIGLDPAARVEGQVLAPDGTPVPGVLVVIRPSRIDAGPHVVHARTDAQGRYVVEGLAPVETRIVVSDAAWRSPRAEEEVPDGYAPCSTLLEPGQTLRLTQRVEPAGAVEGRVVDAAGQGIPGALVRCSLETDVPDATVATDATGAFRLRGLPSRGRCDLDVHAPGHAPWSVDEVPIGARVPDLALERLTPVWIRVRVIDDIDGAPVAGVRADAESRRTRPGREGTFGWERTVLEAHGVTGADGHLWVGPIDRDRLFVRAWDPSGANGSYREVAPTEKEPITLVVASATRLAGLPLQGRILPPKGQPLPERLTLLRSEAGEPPIGALKDGGRPIPVEADGRFRSEGLAPGRYVLRASGVWGGRFVEGQVQATPGEGEIALPLKATNRDAPATWRLRVTTHDGRPVPRATLWVMEDAPPERQSYEEREIRDREHTHVASDPRIGLLLRVVVGDARTLSGRALPYAWAMLEHVAPSDDPITLVLPAEDAQHGRILDPAGRPLSGIRIQAEVLVDRTTEASAEGVRLECSALTGEDGRFRLGGVQADAWRVRLWLEVPPDCAREGPLWTPYGLFPELQIKLCHAVPGRVRVMDAEGVPVAGCELRVEPDELDPWTFDDNSNITGFYSGPGWITVDTAPDGRGGFTRLDPRRAYALFLEPPKARPDLKALHLPAWRPQAEEETIVLPSALR